MVPRVSRRWVIVCAALLLGCESDRSNPTTSNEDLFAPTDMRVHPIFTQISDWTHSGKPDGIEAQLEFTDRFGDPTKASGKVLFELFDYIKISPDPRGKRLGRWVGSLVTQAEQRERWNTTLRTYRFQLDYGSVSATQGYVLTATFELNSGGRFFNSIVLPGEEPAKTQHKQASGLGVQ